MKFKPNLLIIPENIISPIFFFSNAVSFEWNLKESWYYLENSSISFPETSNFVLKNRPIFLLWNWHFWKYFFQSLRITTLCQYLGISFVYSFSICVQGSSFMVNLFKNMLSCCSLLYNCQNNCLIKQSSFEMNPFVDVSVCPNVS